MLGAVVFGGTGGAVGLHHLTPVMLKTAFWWVRGSGLAGSSQLLNLQLQTVPSLLTTPNML